jgi:hypothetical protein
MRVLVRAAAVLALAVTAWSLNVKWGDTTTSRGGPPMQWEKSVVGAVLLVGIAAVLLWIATRPKINTGALRLGVRAAAAIAALGAVGITVYLHRDATSSDLETLLGGPGWTWLAIGTGLAVLAVAGTLVIPSPEPAAPAGKKGGGARKRGGASRG